MDSGGVDSGQFFPIPPPQKSEKITESSGITEKAMESLFQPKEVFKDSPMEIEKLEFPSAKLDKGLLIKAIEDIEMSNLEMETELIDEIPTSITPEDLDNLKTKWRDANINVSSLKSATKLLDVYNTSTIGQRSLGDCVVIVDAENPKQLQIVVREKKMLHFPVQIMPDGKLQFENKIYDTPSQVLASVEKKLQIPLKRMTFEGDQVIDKVMSGLRFPDSVEDYDQSAGGTVSIFIAGKLDATADALINHLLSKLGGVLQKDDFLREILLECLKDDNYKMFNHIIKKYPDSQLSLKKLSIEHLTGTSLEMIKKVVLFLDPQQNREFLSVLLTKLVKQGQTDAIKELTAQNPKLLEAIGSSSKFMANLLSQDRNTFDFILGKTPNPPDPVSILKYSLEWGEVPNIQPIVKWALESGVPPGTIDTKEIFLAVIRNGNLKEFTLILENVSPDEETVKNVISTKNIEMLKLLIAKKIPISSEALANLFYEPREKREKIIDELAKILPGDVLLDALIAAFKTNSIPYLISKFPDLLKDSAAVLTAIQIGVESKNYKALEFVLANTKTPLDSSLVLPFLLNLESNDSLRFEKPMPALTQLVITNLDSFPNVSKQLIPLLVRGGDLVSLTAIVKKYPELNEMLLEACITKGPATFSGDWKLFLNDTINTLTPSAMENIFIHCIAESNLSLLHVLASNVKLDPNIVEKLFQEALNYDEPEIVPSLTSMNLSKDQHEKFLKMAVESNRPAFVAALKPLLGEIPKDLIDASIKNRTLSAALALSPEAGSQFVLSILNQDTAQMFDDLIKIFLNSKTNDVDKLLREMSRYITANEKEPRAAELQQILNNVKSFMSNEGRFIARFPDPKIQNEMHKQYGRMYADYTKQQVAYAQKRAAIYKGVLDEVKKGGLSLYEAYWHLGNIGKDYSSFSTWRFSKDERAQNYETSIIGRYLMFQKVGRSMERKVLSGIEGGKYIGAQHHPTYQIETTTPSGEKAALTSIYLEREGIWFQPKWEHAKESGSRIAMSEMSDLFDDISTKKITKAELDLKIARFFWLGCHAMPTARGNSQYMLELHTMLRELNGLPTSPPSQEFVLPDCVALCTTFEEFYKVYYPKLFESTQVAVEA